jgi:hypothetical protein
MPARGHDWRTVRFWRKRITRRHRTDLRAAGDTELQRAVESLLAKGAATTVGAADSGASALSQGGSIVRLTVAALVILISGYWLFARDTPS